MTYDSDGGANGTSLVGPPLTRSGQLAEASSNVIDNGASTLRRHETKGTKETTELGGDGLDEFWGAEDGSWSDTVIQDLRNGKCSVHVTREASVDSQTR